MMTKHVRKKFSNHIEGIQALLEKDSNFREMVADYEEICSWLDGYCRSEGTPSIECDRAREVIRDLEDEIHNALEDFGF